MKVSQYSGIICTDLRPEPQHNRPEVDIDNGQTSFGMPRLFDLYIYILYIRMTSKTNSTFAKQVAELDNANR